MLLIYLVNFSIQSDFNSTTTARVNSMKKIVNIKLKASRNRNAYFMIASSFFLALKHHH